MQREYQSARVRIPHGADVHCLIMTPAGFVPSSRLHPDMATIARLGAGARRAIQ